LHSNVASGWLAAKPRSAAVSGVLPAGRAVMVVSGGVASTVNALSVTQCVASLMRRTLQVPSVAASNAGQGRVS
jgi:hypothetical protein